MQSLSDSYGDDEQGVPPPWVASLGVNQPPRMASGRFFFALVGERFAGGRRVQ
jgi:hypothetical protein